MIPINEMIAKRKERLELRMKQDRDLGIRIEEYISNNPKPEVEKCVHGTITRDFVVQEVPGNELVWVKQFIVCEKCREDIQRKSFIKACIEGLNIPERYKGVLEDDEYLEAIKNKKGVIFTGAVGTGKTYKLVGLIKSVANNMYPMGLMFRTFGSIIRKIKDSIGNNSYDDLFNQFLEPYIFVIDDLGIEQGSEFTKQFLNDFVNERYNQGKLLMITTNLTSEELQNLYSERLLSRLMEMCEVVKLNGSDRRIKDS